jgi:hypothetical protein
MSIRPTVQPPARFPRCAATAWKGHLSADVTRTDAAGPRSLAGNRVCVPTPRTSPSAVIDTSIDRGHAAFDDRKEELTDHPLEIADVSARGALFVAVAGNGDRDATPSYPAAYEKSDRCDGSKRGSSPIAATTSMSPRRASAYELHYPASLNAILAAVHDRVHDKSREEFPQRTRDPRPRASRA